MTIIKELDAQIARAANDLTVFQAAKQEVEAMARVLEQAKAPLLLAERSYKGHLLTCAVCKVKDEQHAEGCRLLQVFILMGAPNIEDRERLRDEMPECR